MNKTTKHPAKAGRAKKKKKSDSAFSFDRRLLEKALDTQHGKRKQNPLRQAQKIIYDAWECRDPEERIAFALGALALSPHCADAYVLLAEEAAGSLKEALRLYQMGTEAGEKALGKAAFRKDAGHFWGILESRPYMRARAGLAQCLWISGLRQEAVTHYTGMLKLNPNDNQGIRYVLLPCLIELGQDKEAEQLWKEYSPEPSAFWTFSKALLDFRKNGASLPAEKALHAAVRENAFVVPYLIGRRKLPRSVPEMYSLHSEEEAMIYAKESLGAWKFTPGALAWLTQKAHRGFIIR